MVEYGCRWRGIPHDLYPVGENNRIKVERCKLCPITLRWPKGHLGRTDNVKYLKAHARNFAQKGGATHRLFMKMYEPEKAIITI